MRQRMDVFLTVGVYSEDRVLLSVAPGHPLSIVFRFLFRSASVCRIRRFVQSVRPGLA